MVKIFYSYSHKDEHLKEMLDVHLNLLKRNKVIADWHDRKIIPGQNWESEIDDNINDSDIVLLLVSADFLASDYCYDKEMSKIIQFHREKTKIVIPIMLRECNWEGAPFQGIQGLPTDLKPVISKHWHNPDEAFNNIVTGLKKQIQLLYEKKQGTQTQQYATVKTLLQFVSINNNKYTYDGEVFAGVPNGYGKAEFENGDRYIGNWLNGKIHGYGLYTWANGRMHIGEWQNHVRTGQGIEFDKNSNIIQQGVFSENKLVKHDPYNNTTTKTISCSFCGKARDQVKLMIKGIDINYICENCVTHAVEICSEEKVKLEIDRKYMDWLSTHSKRY